MDKEKLIKHHFWILLGLALILLPVALSGVWMGVAEATTKQAQTVESKKKALTSSSPKGETYVNALEQQRLKLDDSKGTVWKVNAVPQSGLIRWPRQLSQLDSLYFGEPLTDDQRTTFKRNDVYLAEFEELAQLVKPTELAGGWEKVLSFVKFGAKFPSNEDCWLALEDLCIQREMLSCVREVNNLLARFWDETASSDKELKEYFKPTADESVFRFTSPYWHLDLALSPATQGKGNELNVRGRLINKSHRRLNVARIDFLLSMFDPAKTEGRPVVLPVEGQFIGVGEAIEFKDKRLPGSNTKPTVYVVEQRLDNRFVPVKRIERIALGYNSHRTADKPLVMGAVSEEEKKKAPQPAGEGEGNAPPAAGAAGPDLSTSRIPRLRYVTVTEQVRRMPIGVVLVVDQAHVQDILRAFANSRLHFQTTQMHLSRYRGGSGSGPAPAGGAEDMNTNLVEVAVYGLASIYEKYPPKNAAAAQSVPPAAPPAAPAPNQPKGN